MPATFRLVRLSALLLAAASPLAGCTAQVSERTLFHPIPGGMPSADAMAKAAPSYVLTPQTIIAPDGTKLGGLLLRQPGSRATVLYFGGNGFTIERFGPLAASIFAPLGVDLMLVDHRGYGMSGGQPSAAAVGEDGIAAFDHLAALPGMSASRIVVHGQSLGSFVAGHVAANRPAAGVVLESSVTTAEDWIAARTRGVPVKVRLDPSLRGMGNLREMKGISEPLLVLVGAKDGVTPPELSQALYAASPLPATRKTLAIIPGAGHNDVLAHPEATGAYRAFLARAVP